MILYYIYIGYSLYHHFNMHVFNIKYLDFTNVYGLVIFRTSEMVESVITLLYVVNFQGDRIRVVGFLHPFLVAIVNPYHCYRHLKKRVALSWDI